MPICNRLLKTLLGSLTITAGVVLCVHTGGTSAASTDVPSEQADSIPLGLSVDAVSELRVGESTRFNRIDLPDDRQVDLELQRFSVLAPDARIISSSAAGDRMLDLSDLVLLRGKVVGEETSEVFLSVSRSGTQGFLKTSEGVYSVSSGLQADGFGGVDDLRITKIEGPIAGWNQPPVSCGVDVNDPLLHPHGLPRPIQVSELEGRAPEGPPCRVARLAIDTDWEFSAQLFGGDTEAAAAYALTLVAGVGQIYQSNVNVRFVVGYLRVWEDNSDPYNLGEDLLQEFRSHWNSVQGGVDRNLAHLFSGRNNLPYGGVAYLNALCSSSFGYGVSGYLNGSFPYPLINNNGGNWDLVVVAHELGHNFGTGHTHSAYSPPIDNCGNDDCTGAENGTIMSYCHTCPGGISNITLNFHPLVQTQILNYLDSACDLTANEATAVDDFAATLPGEPVLIDILLNDQASSCDVVAIESLDLVSTAGGEIEEVVDPDGNGRNYARYTPSVGFSGLDTFEYTIVGGATAIVEIDVLQLRQPDVTGATTPGVSAEFFELDQPEVLPDFGTLEPYATSEFESINFVSTGGEFAGSGRSDDVGAVFKGFIEVPTPGMYTLFAESDDGSRLFIGDEQILDNDGLHAMQERSGSMALASGKHAVRVEFFERGGGAGLIVRFEGPGISKRVVEPARWSRPIDCPGDVSGDGQVDLADLNLVLANFGQAGSQGDANADGVIDLADLNLILGRFGVSCE